MNTKQQWSLLTALGCVAILVAGWFLAVSPQHKHAAKLHAQAADVQSSVSQLRSQIAMLRAEQKDLPRQQATLTKVQQRIPDNPALPSLIRQLSDAADAAGAELVSLNPQAPAAATGVAPSAVAPAHPTAGAAPTSSPLAVIPLAVTANGTYFELEQFVSNLEALPRAFLVSGLGMSPGTSTAGGAAAAAPATSTTTTLNVTVTARVFMTGSVTPTVAPVKRLTPAGATS